MFGSGMFRMWNVRDIGCSGCGIGRMWVVECLPGCDMLIYKILTTTISFFAKIVNSYKPLTIFAKKLYCRCSAGSKYTCA